MLESEDKYVEMKSLGRRVTVRNLQLHVQLVIGGLSLEGRTLQWWVWNDRVVKFLINICVPPYSVEIPVSKNAKWSNYQWLKLFLQEVGNPTRILPDFAGFLIPCSLPQQVSCNQHHHDRDCAKDDRPEPSTEAAIESPGYSALRASSL